MLYIVATPIGNLDDISRRAIAVLQEADVIAVEDSRHSKSLLSHWDIKTATVAYHEHNAEAQTPKLVARMQAGEKVALISDAGTPLVSDPGFRLVRAAHDNDIQVVPVPGACAAIAALSASGLPTDKFQFEGFLSSKSVARCKQLTELQHETRTLIFYEAPHRVLACLQDMLTVFGEEREVVLAREVTKLHETIHHDTLKNLVEFVTGDSNQQRGEIVLLVRGADDKQQSNVAVTEEHILDVLLSQLSVKQASELAAKITGAKKNALYQKALAKKSDS